MSYHCLSSSILRCWRRSRSIHAIYVGQAVPAVDSFSLPIGTVALWAGTAVAYGCRSRGACGNCGRTDAGGGWTAPESAARWRRWATYVAVLVPLPYAAIRWVWALGFLLGISEEFPRDGQEIGLGWAGAALSTVDLAGVVLTLGLIQR